VQALIYTPEGKGSFPGILVIHEWWGLNDWVKEHASKLSDLGYFALAIDLYRSRVATTPDEAHEIIRGVRAIALPAICTRPSNSLNRSRT
jgi:carboxymethylenebutenolidase